MTTTSVKERVAAGGPRKGSGMSKAAYSPARGQARAPLQFATILVPVDFSSSSEAAYEYALELAERFDSRVRLLHVVEDKTSPDFKSFPLALSRPASTAAARRKLVEFAQSGSHSLVPVSPETKVGVPWREIVQAAENGGAGLIVIPTHGRTGLKHVLMGSVAEKVVRHASCPVLVVRGGEVDLLVTRKTAGEETKEKI